ncbi:YeiH family protein [Botrimarina mediterranea]|uniref:Sulfate exporter family transporter n=1 Tax=Botrimarina mediterranea TaxID=2528022 RepID=A0A518KDE8_9BACT|nr:putative sulfate exporter family transporter [Botrimarina mediterranea]QDV75822.1 hypothetical protein Spa11_40450 [Botrimarina mediterranea]QDV80419.1 hypothetical protein K2D_40480 [Planctomycetes bacterium K2D]
MPKLTEDWLAVVFGGLLLLISFGAVLAAGGDAGVLKPWLTTPGAWEISPLPAFGVRTFGIAGAAAVLAITFGAASRLADGTPLRRFLPAFGAVFLLALVAYLGEEQKTFNYWGLAYPLWAIVLGLLISNTIGLPDWVRPAVRTELYMKVGLVLLGAEVLLGKLLALGLPGIAVAWIVTPVVLCTTFWFGQRVLRIESPSLNMVVSADMSVCGVSAAIATAAACRAKKEELSLAIGLSMAFTVVMMLVMPPVIRAMDLPPAVGGAWIGGTIDSTGAVGAAGTMLASKDDRTALDTAVTIKMIQNVLIGVVALGVATYWVTVVDKRSNSNILASPRRESGKEAPSNTPDLHRGLATPSGFAGALAEIWRRMPKFILGFLGASIAFSLLSELHPDGAALTKATLTGATKTLRGWCFALAFASIGLETNFRQLAGPLRSGKPLVLYACGQSLNLALTLAMSWLMFGVLFPPATPPQAATTDQPGLNVAEAGVDPSAMYWTDHPRAWAVSDGKR